jgi:hypothetical protein
MIATFLTLALSFDLPNIVTWLVLISTMIFYCS